MRAAGVDESSRTVPRQRHRLTRCIVRKTQDHQVNGVDNGKLGDRILALFNGQTDKLDVIACHQTLADLEPGRAVLAVDKYFWFCHRCSVSNVTR